ALVTFGSGTMLYRAKRPQVKNIPENQAVPARSDTSAHVRGNPDAPVTLEEFADFQCPPCGQFAPFAEELLREYDSRLRVVFRNFPLPAHEHAREAALVGEAAGFQGKFWEMHDTLYREQLAWSKAPNARELFESYAGTLGLTMDELKKDMEGTRRFGACAWRFSGNKGHPDAVYQQPPCGATGEKPRGRSRRDQCSA